MFSMEKCLSHFFPECKTFFGLKSCQHYHTTTTTTIVAATPPLQLMPPLMQPLVHQFQVAIKHRRSFCRENILQKNRLHLVYFWNCDSNQKISKLITKHTTQNSIQKLFLKFITHNSNLFSKVITKLFSKRIGHFFHQHL